MERLQKRIANSGFTSRRKAEELIKAGRVKVNGQVITEMGFQVSPKDLVEVDGIPLETEEKRYYCLNKPRGVISSVSDDRGRKTIIDLLPPELKQYRLYPVGRLDYDTKGIILITNDGDWSHQMTHPSFKKTKRYLATLNKPLQPLHRQMISDFGVDLPDGRSQLALTRQNDGDDTRWVVEMSEGRNRQIRRTFSALGYTVIRLHRTDFGNYSLGDIRRGECKMVDIS